jgi:hypothetical protein
MSYRCLRLVFPAVLLVCFSFSTRAQQRALGTWKMFLPYGNSQMVCDAGDRIFSATEKSVFWYEKSTGTIQTYDKATGLSDIGVKTIGFDPATKVLAIAYNNSNIDLIYNYTDIYNIPDIKNESGSGSIGINSFAFYNGNVYVSTDLGISVINLDRKEISNTYIIGSTGGQTKIYATAVDGTNIYAATQEGVKHALLASPNLQDFNNWHIYDTTQNIPSKKATFIAAFNNKVYAVIGSNNCDTLFQFDGNTWSRFYFDSLHTFTGLQTVNGNLYFSNWSTSDISGKNGKVDGSGNLTLFNSQHARPMNWFESNGISWEADLWGGLFKNNNGSTEWIIPDGPKSANVFALNISEGVLNVAPGGVDESYGYEFKSDGIFMYKNGKWNCRNMYTDPVLNGVLDIIATHAVSDRGKTYFGSFFTGLVEYDNVSGSINIYDKNNSILEGDRGDTQRTKITCFATDRYNNLWLGNAGANKPIKLIQPDGTWRGFSVPFNFALTKKMIIDANEQLWAPLRSSNGGLLVWSYNGTIDNTSDDLSRVLNAGTGAGGLPNGNVNCLAEDKDGNIWVGTNEGIAVYYCPGSIFTSQGCDADQIKVQWSDGYIGYLFATEMVKAIAVDAANRKWVGTTNGVWLISADGKTELLKFNTDNSPLPDNQITDIAIDPVSGEVFIGTLGGLVSYQGDAIEDCSHCSEALVYPNPVKPDYDGPIAIKGLTDNAYVKITDASGILVFQGKANGTQMIWNGKGYTGKRVKSGVYLVFSSTDLGKERRVAKILLMN